MHILVGKTERADTPYSLSKNRPAKNQDKINKQKYFLLLLQQGFLTGGYDLSTPTALPLPPFALMNTCSHTPRNLNTKES